MVHLLPHERLDRFKKVVQRIKDMANCLDHKDCSKFLDEKQTCLWPLYHEDKETLKKIGKIRGITIKNQFPERAAGLQVITRKQAIERCILAEDNTEEKTDNKLLGVVKFL